jgi:hypothetical protein
MFEQDPMKVNLSRFLKAAQVAGREYSNRALIYLLSNANCCRMATFQEGCEEGRCDLHGSWIDPEKWPAWGRADVHQHTQQFLAHPLCAAVGGLNAERAIRQETFEFPSQ